MFSDFGKEPCPNQRAFCPWDVTGQMVGTSEAGRDAVLGDKRLRCQRKLEEMARLAGVTWFMFPNWKSRGVF